MECAPPPPPCRKTQTFSIWAELRASDISCLRITGSWSLKRTRITSSHLLSGRLWGSSGVPRRRGLWAPLWLLSQRPPLSELYIRFPLFEVKREFCTHAEKGSKPREFPRVWLQCSEVRQPDSVRVGLEPRLPGSFTHACVCAFAH